MASIGFVPVVGGALNALFGTAAPYVNGGVALLNVAPWIGELAHLTGSAPQELKDLHKALEMLHDAAQKNDFTAFSQAALIVEQAIDALNVDVEKPEKPHSEVFKNGGWTGKWVEYLQPLADLRKELACFRTRGINGYETSRLEQPISKVAEFLNEEITKQKGAVNKVLDKIGGAISNKIQDAIRTPGADGQRPVDRFHPLFRIQEHFREFRFNKSGTYGPIAEDKLKQDLKDLEDSDPLFKGVYDAVVNQSANLLDEGDKHLFRFIKEQVAPKLNQVHLNQEIADTAKLFGRKTKRLDKLKESSSRSRSTLFSAVGTMMEIEKFEKEMAPLELPAVRTPEAVARHIDQTIDTLRRHPSFTKHRDFNGRMEKLIKSFVDATYAAYGNAASQDVQLAYHANNRDHFGDALLILQAAHRKAQGGSPSSVVQQATATLKAYAEKFGVPKEALESLDSVAKTVENATGALMGKTEEAQPRDFHPLQQLMSRLDRFQSSSKRVNAQVLRDNLLFDLRLLEKESSFFEGLTQTLRGYLTPEQVKSGVTQWIINHADCLENPQMFHELLYYAAERHGALGEIKTTTDQKARTQKGLEFFKKGIHSDKEMKALWDALAQYIELSNYQTFSETVTLSEDPTIHEVSEKVSLAIAFFEKQGQNPVARKILKGVCAQVSPLVDALYVCGKPLLTPKERRAFEYKINEATDLAESGKHLEALKVLKELLSEGPLAQKSVAQELHETSSALEVLTKDFTKDTQKTNAPKVDQTEWDRKINEQKQMLSENLTYFSTFNVIDKYCGFTNEEGSNSRYQDILDELGDLKGKARKEAFLNILKSKIEERPNLGFFDKVGGKLLTNFVFSAVQFFASSFVESFTQHVHSLALSPIESALMNDHLTPIKGMNNALLSLLAAEGIWEKDELGNLGAQTKQDKIYEILNNPELNGKLDVSRLYRHVVRKAINDFLNVGSLVSASKRKIEALNVMRTGEGTSDLGAVLATIGQGGLVILRPVFGLIDLVYSVSMKKGASLLINKLQIVNTVLESMNNTIYRDTKFTSGPDQVILDWLKGVLELLDQEGGGMAIHEGANGRRLFKELTANLFELLDARKQLTPSEETSQKHLLSLLKRDIDEMADGELQKVVSELLIFAYNSIRTEKMMNETIYNSLVQANQGLLPAKAENRLVELYPKEVDALRKQAEIEDPENPEKKLQELLVARFKAERNIEGTAYYMDIDAALKEKYTKVESEIPKVMDQILTKAIDKVVEDQVGDYLQTPEGAMLGFLDWFDRELIPELAPHQTDELTHLEALITSLDDEDVEAMQKRQAQFMARLSKQVKILEAKAGQGTPQENHQIQTLLKGTKKLVDELSHLNNAIASKESKKAEEAIYQFMGAVRQQHIIFKAVRHTIETREKTLLERGSLLKNALLETGAKSMAPAVTSYVKSRLSGRAEEALLMYKDPNVFQAMLRHVVLLNFLHSDKQEAPSKNGRKNVESISENDWFPISADPTSTSVA